MLDITLPDSLSQARPGEWRRLADITADAFAEDPVSRWIFGNPRAIRSAFRVLARHVYAPGGICHLAGEDGATMWMDCRAGPPGGGPFWVMLLLAAGQLRHGSKGALRRAMAAGEIMDRHHPHEPHLYLFTIAARKAARGKGLGKALLAPVLAACDREGMACYLENSNPANHGFYAAHGFERREIFACGEGGPPLEAMWRAPRQPV
ncbi:MAG: GNAT family N-acetyltransferase [Pseudomonadota bacterium]